MRILVTSLAISWLRPFRNELVFIVRSSGLQLAKLFAACCWQCSFLFFCLSTCCAGYTARPELPDSLHVPPMELDCRMPALKVSVIHHWSCLRAPDTAHFVRPCLKRLTWGKPTANIVHSPSSSLFPVSVSAPASASGCTPPRNLDSTGCG